MKIRYGLVLAIATLFGVTACASGGGSTGGTTLADLTAGVAQGERPRDTENTRAAERALEEAEGAADPAAARVLYQQALTSAEAGIAEDATNPLAYRLGAMAALGLEDYETAGDYFDRAMELRPLYEFEDRSVREQTWIDLYQQAAPLVQSGDYEGAAQVFENAHAIYAGRPEAMITLGQLYAQLQQYDRSIEYLNLAQEFMASEQAMAADSATAASWQEQAAEIPSLRAQVFAAGGRFEEAVSAYRGLIAEEPDNLEYTRNLASILMQMGNEAEALQVYEDLLTRPNLTGADFYSIGIGFYQASDYERAIRAFAGAAEANPRDRDALEMWARSMQLDSAYADVPPVAERWIELDPNSQNGYLILAQAANQNGDQATTQEAVQAVEALEVNVDQLQLRRFGGGGGVVSGSVINKTRAAGETVTLRVTFYGTSNTPIGTVTETVTLGGEGMAQVFQAQLDSAEEIGGYSYELTVG